MSPQDVARIVSLRLPERASPTSIAPQALLSAPGLSGAPGLNPLVMALLNAFRGIGVGGVGPTGGVVTKPKIHPINDGQQSPTGGTAGPGGSLTPETPSPETPGLFDPEFRDWLRQQRRTSPSGQVPGGYIPGGSVPDIPRQDFPLPSPLPGDFGAGSKIPQDFPVPEGPLTPLF